MLIQLESWIAVETANAQIVKFNKDFEKELKGRVVIFPYGKYKGRPAVIDYVYVDWGASPACISVGLYIARLDRKGYLDMYAMPSHYRSVNQKELKFAPRHVVDELLEKGYDVKHV